ncbi:MAG: efflux RND transporter periplasmic adaptor subunit [Sideroxydans sp.]|nr:efflux RND transporter periplasmic adaptor subunit [Sideroxydans sp.]
MSASSAGKPSAAFRRVIIILPIAVALIFGGWYLTRAKPVTVTLAKVARGTVEAAVSNTRAGTVKACRRAKMAPPAGGQIAALLVKKGERVVAGQVLLRLWSKDLQAEEKLAREQLGTAQTQARQACLQADLAAKEAERARQLQAQHFISPEGLDQKVSAARVSRAGCEAAHSMVEQSRSRIAVAQAGLERMTLRAPFAGIVADISGEQGEFATPSPPGIPTPPALDLIDDSCLYVSAPIDEVDAAHVREGLPGRITMDAIKGQQFPAKVRRVAPYVLDLEKQARTVEVEMEFLQLPKAEHLLVGYSADVEIIYDSHANVLRIPTSALMEGKHVLVYRNGVLEDRVVGTGLSNWEYTEITSGLGEGDQVVLSLDRAGVKAGARALPDASASGK